MDYKVYNYDNYNVYVLNTNKFKSTYISLCLLNEFNKDNLTKNTLLRKLLVLSTSKYKNEKEVYMKVCDLYNAGVNIYNDSFNNVISTEFSIEILDDKYTNEGNMKDTLDYFFHTIFEPNIINNEFEKSNFDIAVKAIKDVYIREKDNKNSYALKRAFSQMREDTLKYDFNGCMEELDKLTPSSMVTYYNELIKDANANIFIVGNVDNTNILDIISEYMKNKFNNNKNTYEFKKYIDNDYTVEKIEEDNNNQSKLNIIYKMIDMTDRERNLIFPVLNKILGAGTSSKLFNHVREELSLCYSISSFIMRSDSILTITAGISFNTKDKVINQINKEIEDIKNGLITNEEFDSAMKSRYSLINKVYDDNESLCSVMIGKELFKNDDLETRKKDLKTVTKEEIQNLAKKMNLCVTYILKGENESE